MMKKILGLVLLLCSSYGSERSIVGWWDFDEGEGEFVKDLSGNENDGGIFGAEWVDGIKGKALNFDGADDYVEIPCRAVLDITDEITVEFWMYLDIPASAHSTRLPIVIEKWGGWDNTGPFCSFLNRVENSFIFRFDGVEKDCSYSFTPKPRRWYFITATFKAGDTAKFYVDGRLMKTDDASKISALSRGIQFIRIGGGRGYAFFSGIVDEIRIYNRVLSADEIKANYRKHADVKGPIGVWSFDEGEGNIIRDISGNNHHGKISAEESVNVEWVEGIKGKALEFDGIDDSVEIPYDPSFDITDEITVTFWMYLNIPVSEYTAKWQIVIERWSGWNTGPFFATLSQPGNSFTFTFDGVEGDCRYSFTLKPKKWYFIAASFKANSKAKFYVDGKLMKTDDASKISALSRDKFLLHSIRIGGKGRHCFNGIIDEVAIYSRQLSEDEIKIIYEKKTTIGLSEKKPLFIEVKNSGFELDVDKNGIPDEWTILGKDKEISVGDKTLIDTKVFHCGKKSIKVITQSGAMTGISQWIPYDRKIKNYIISGGIKTDLPVDIRAHLGVSYYTTDKKLLETETDLISISGKTDWKKYTAIFPIKRVPENTKLLKLWCYVNIDRRKFEGGGSAWFDEISIEPVERVGVINYVSETGEFIIVDKDEKIIISNLYRCNFTLPFTRKGYLLAEKNYLEDISQDTPLTFKKDFTLSTFITPGEYEPLCFVIYAVKDLKNVKIEVSDLKKKEAETIIPRSNIDIRYGMRVLQRRRHHFSAVESLPTTRFLRKFTTIDIPEKEFREIYLILKAPDDAKPGLYKGKIRIFPENADPSTIDISLNVLPFKLKNPPHKKYGMYYRLRDIHSKETRLELRDIKQHGCEVIYPYISISYSMDAEKKIIPDYKGVRDTLRVLKEFGFSVVIIDTGFDSLARLLGYKYSKDIAVTTDIAKKISEDKRFLSAAKKALEGLKDIQKEYPGIKILITHLDEVMSHRYRFPLYIAYSKAARQVPDFKLYVTFDTGISKGDAPHKEQLRKEIDTYVDVRHHHSYTWEWWLARGNTMEEYEEELRKSGDIAGTYYNPVGVYCNAEFYRVVTGLASWIGPFTYHIPWIYKQNHENIFNDLDGRSSDIIFGFYSRMDRSMVTTRIWEGWREGIDDIRYLYTLQCLINENLTRKPKLAEEAQEWIKKIEELIPEPQGLHCDDSKLLGTERECPWTYEIMQEFSSKDYQDIRWQAAQFIMELTK